jgi:hypothetical protein
MLCLCVLVQVATDVFRKCSALFSGSNNSRRITGLVGLLDPEDGSTMIFPNVVNQQKNTFQMI